MTAAPDAACLPVAPPQLRQLDALTGLRGIAAWLVVLFHTRLTLTGVLPGWVMPATGRFYLAVDLFFMLSGFVMWYTYAERLRCGGRGEAARFWWRRIARIWPLHAAILLAYVVFALAVLLRGRDASAYPFAELPLHLLLMQNWGLTHTLRWNDPAWSISTEWAAYLLFPLVVRLCRWDRLPSLALLGLVALLFAALHLMIVASGQDRLGAAIPQLGLPRCLMEFAAGNVLCILWQRWRGWRGTAPLAALVGAGALGLGLWGDFWDSAYSPTVLFAGLLALACAKGPVARLLAGRLAVDLGEMSYSTYLSHFLLFVLFKIMFIGPQLQLGWLGLIGYGAMVFSASVLLYHGVEKPAQRWLNAHSPWQPRGQAVPAH